MTVRRHGWQYPAHVYQVVAIVIFFTLSMLYMFVVLFVGSVVLKNVMIGLYSALAFIVFVLYIRCAAIDPADAGILVGGSQTLDKQVVTRSEKPGFIERGAQEKQIISSDNIHDIENPSDVNQNVKKKQQFSALLWLLEDDACVRNHNENLSAAETNTLFCTLCNAQVKKFSKHCRSCNKCVEGFDHHCWWLNNCIGRKNYFTFLWLMATCLAMLLLDSAIGLVVLQRSFVNKTAIESYIAVNFSRHLSVSSLSAIVGLFTLIPLVASVPLAELFFFHMILLQKGLTTYEYVIAMRAQSVPQAINDCASEKETLDQKGDVLITAGKESKAILEKESTKSAIKISAFKLAKLNTSDVSEAAKHARERSSVLLRLKSQDLEARESGCDSTSSNESTIGIMDAKESSAGSTKHSKLQFESRAHSGTQINEHSRIQSKSNNHHKLISESRERSGLEFESSEESTEFVEIQSGSNDQVGVQSESKEQVGIQSESSEQMGVQSDLKEQVGIQSEPLVHSLTANEMSNDVNDIMTTTHPLCEISSEEPRPLKDFDVEPTTEDTILTSPHDRHGLPVCHATILPSIEHRTWICTTPVHEDYKVVRDDESSIGPQRGGLVDPTIKGSGTIYWDRVTGQFRSIPDMSRTLKVSTHPLSTIPIERCSGQEEGSLKLVGRQYESSLGKSPIISSLNVDPSIFEGPLRLIPSNRNMGKENSLKSMENDSHRHKLILSTNQSSLQAGSSLSLRGVSRTISSNIVLSRFTPL